MINWHEAMIQTYEYYIVDPNTWKDQTPITDVERCSITRDSGVDTLGSATIDCKTLLDECYVRAYLSVIQNGENDKVPLGTFIVQTPSESFDGKTISNTYDGYTPLIELKEKSPPIGYSLLKDQEIMSVAVSLCRENMRAPVVPAKSTKTLYADFVSNTNDTWLTFLRDLVSNAKYNLDLDELGQLIFSPVQDTASIQSVWTYSDDDISILYPDITNQRDLYGIPNVVEVVYSTDAGNLYSKVVNNDPTSPISTINRGREILYRDTNPSVSGTPDQAYIDNYATQLLRNLSCLEHTITYKHGYCPVRVGDVVTINYKKAGLNNVRAKVISQSINCETGCPVEETATYTTKLWR